MTAVARHLNVDRWDADPGPQVEKRVLEEIKKGALGDFLNGPFYAGELSILSSPQDLRGISLLNLKFDGPDGNDHFKYSDLSFARIAGCSFENASFFGTVFDHARLENVTFTRCTFVDVSLYAADTVDVTWDNCDFISAAVVNADMHACSFRSCYFRQPVFADCRFDDATNFESWRSARLNAAADAIASAKAAFDKAKASVYAGLQEGYAAGGVGHEARRYFFDRNAAATRHNTPPLRQPARFAFEVVAGYGVRPLRILFALLLVLSVSIAYFSISYGSAGVLLATGAFFTFGAESHILANAPVRDVVIYVLTAAIGTAGIATFITLLATTVLRRG